MSTSAGNADSTNNTMPFCRELVTDLAFLAEQCVMYDMPADSGWNDRSKEIPLYSKEVGWSLVPDRVAEFTEVAPEVPDKDGNIANTSDEKVVNECQVRKYREKWAKHLRDGPRKAKVL